MERRSFLAGLAALLATGGVARADHETWLRGGVLNYDWDEDYDQEYIPRRRRRGRRRRLQYYEEPEVSRPQRRKRQARKEKRRSYGGKSVVAYGGAEKAGTIEIRTGERALYYVLKGRKAIRYGIAVGKAGFQWSGTARVGNKVHWPSWTPPAEMIERRPELEEYAGGMPGGPDNPLGARALYLYKGKRDTLYRIHGTNEPWSIGTAASSGCIRMLNEEVVDLYARAPIGTRVVVR